MCTFKVRILLKAMNEYEDDISKATSFEKKLNIYGNYFSDINEALQIVKDDVKNDQHSNNDTVVSFCILVLLFSSKIFIMYSCISVAIYN